MGASLLALAKSIYYLFPTIQFMLDSERELPGPSKGHRKRRREKLPSMEVLIIQGKALLAKKRKERHLEFSTDPVSGNRSSHIPPQKFKSETKLEIVPKGVIV